jgi:hypothetical protein
MVTYLGEYEYFEHGWAEAPDSVGANRHDDDPGYHPAVHTETSVP